MKPCPGCACGSRPREGHPGCWHAVTRSGRMRRFPVGAWPKYGIAAARDAAREMRVKVRAGEDPIADGRRNRARGRDALAGIGTLEALLALYSAKAAVKLKSWPETRRRVELVFKDHLKQPLAALTRQDLQLAADSYPASQQANGALGGLRPLLKWSASPWLCRCRPGRPSITGDEDAAPTVLSLVKNCPGCCPFSQRRSALTRQRWASC